MQMTLMGWNLFKPEFIFFILLFLFTVLVDKDQNPKWDPPTLEGISKETVDWYFSRLPEDRELKLWNITLEYQQSFCQIKEVCRKNNIFTKTYVMVFVWIVLPRCLWRIPTTYSDFENNENLKL